MSGRAEHWTSGGALPGEAPALPLEDSRVGEVASDPTGQTDRSVTGC